MAARRSALQAPPPLVRLHLGRSGRRHVVIGVAIRRKNNPQLIMQPEVELTIRAEIVRFSDFWTGVLRVRDREAPGSNPGPPTSF